jgi:hypothetical protein
LKINFHAKYKWEKKEKKRRRRDGGLTLADSR